MPLCLLVVALAAGDSPSSWGYPLRAGRCWLPLAGAALAAPYMWGQAMVDFPCKGLGHGQPPVQMNDSTRFNIIICSLKPNFRTKTFSDTTIGKPQREHHMRSENQNKTGFPCSFIDFDL
ncbi:hypothetical protein GW17_00008935 [Ensete ventricosum]|nr:hypothetical protein GW17_00008935 [Ensete ventricosum]